jgi:hypothetical protein
MGCEMDFGDDFEKCQDLIDEYEDLLCKQQTEKLVDIKDQKIKEEKEELKNNIREMLENINNKVKGIAQVDKLQQLNQKYQILLTEESKM